MSILPRGWVPTVSSCALAHVSWGKSCFLRRFKGIDIAFIRFLSTGAALSRAPTARFGIFHHTIVSNFDMCREMLTE